MADSQTETTPAGPIPPFSTLAEAFFTRVAQPDYPHALMVKRGGRFDSIAMSEVKAAVIDIAAGLLALGVKRGDKVVLISENRPEWLYADYALMLLGAVNVPIYATLTPPLIEFIIKDSGAGLVIASNETQYKKIQEIRGNLPALKTAVIFDPPAAPAAGDLTLAALLQKGMAAPGREERVRAAAAEVHEKDLASLVYTSGTTGEPKGVMLSHENFAQNILNSLRIIQMTPDDRALSLLPLCHTFERVVDYIGFLCGTTIAYAESVDKARDNLLEVHPSVMAGVPRLYEKIFASFMEGAQQKLLGRLLVNDAVAVARAVAAARLLPGAPPAGGWMKFKHWLYDLLIYGKLREKMGGNIRFFISGGAPLSRDNSLFFHGAGLPIVEGYGLSETSPVITMNPLGAIRPGSPGRPIPNVEVKIADDGEILTRSRSVMQGYYNHPEKTAEVMKDGWFCTGDVGHLDPDGYLFITDRKKDLIKTSGGKYVAPQGVEAALKQSHYIAEAAVFGDGRKYVAALLVPDFAQLAAWAKAHGWPETPTAELVKKPEVLALYESEIAAAQKELPNYEQIKKFALLPQDFTLGAGEMTPTMKIRRKVVGEKYKALIEPLFE